MDIKLALVDIATNIKDNRDEVICILSDYITLRLKMSCRIDDNNLNGILDNLDNRYKEVLDELNNEYFILTNIASYIASYIGYDEKLGEFLYDYIQNMVECVDTRSMYLTFLRQWYEDIITSPIKTTNNYEFPKYQEQITRSDVVKVMLLQKI